MIGQHHCPTPAEVRERPVALLGRSILSLALILNSIEGSGARRIRAFTTNALPPSGAVRGLFG